MDNTGDAGAPDEKREAPDGLRSELTTLLRAFMASPERAGLFLLGAAIVVVVAGTAFGQIKLNAWNKPFYDALARKDFDAFATQLLVFGAIAGGLLILNVAQIWLNQMTKLKLREGLVRDLADQWLEPKRAFRLAGAGEIGVNPDQRIHEDVRHLTELSTDLGIGLLQATLLLISFAGVLWILSDNVIFRLAGRSFSIPGYMVWCAALYAAAGSWLSWLVGRPLIPLNAKRYSREADLRFTLVRINEHADAIALYGGEADEKQRLNRDLDKVLAVMRQLVRTITQLTWITAGYGWLAIIVPILVAAPGFFGGDLTIGGLLMVAGAFTQVQQALRWFVDNFSTIADWLATVRRVASFRRALVDMDRLGREVGQIETVKAADGHLAFDNLRVFSSGGCASLSDAHVEVAPGEHVLVLGDAGADLAALFRALAGLWPWGSGRISFPAGAGVMFVPQRSYMSPGALRDALSYPSPPTAFTDIELTAAINRVGLQRLSSQLDRDAHWDSELANDELQRMAFARLLLHKPDWVCLYEAIDSIDEKDRASILALFDHDLAATGVITLGRRDIRDGFSARILHLINNPEGPRLTPYVYPAAPPRTQRAVSAT